VFAPAAVVAVRAVAPVAVVTPAGAADAPAGADDGADDGAADGRAEGGAGVAVLVSTPPPQAARRAAVAAPPITVKNRRRPSNGRPARVLM